MEHYKQKTLPDKFKAISQEGWAYTCNRTSRDTYSVRWNAQGGGFRFTDYAEATLKEIIFKDKAWVIVEDEKTMKELPESFKFTTPHNETIFQATLEEGYYRVTWRDMISPAFYSNDKEFQETFEIHDWKVVKEPESNFARILREACLLEGAPEIVKPSASSGATLESIKKFCKDSPQHAVVISDKGFEVYWDDCGEPIVADTEDKLLDVMKAVTLIESCYGA